MTSLPLGYCFLCYFSLLALLQHHGSYGKLNEASLATTLTCFGVAKNNVCFFEAD